MRALYRIDDFQETYFVIDGFDQLFDATRPDFAPLYREVAGLGDLAPGAALPEDRLVS
jgi:phenylalanine-4-hydroxylase